MSDGFNLSMRTEYCQVTSYSPIEGWEGYFRESRELISNQDEMRDLYDKAAYLVIDNKDCFPPEEVATFRAYLDK